MKYIFGIVTLLLANANLLSQESWNSIADQADSLRSSGDYLNSIGHYKNLFSLLPIGDDDLRHKYEIRIGLSYFMMGDNEGAKKHYRYVIDHSKYDTVSIYRGHAFNNLGLLFDNSGSFSESVSAYERAGEVFKQLNEKSLYNRTEMNIGKVWYKKGKYLKALQKLTKVARSFEQSEDSLRMAETYSSIGLIQESLGSIEKAKEFHEKAISIREEIKDDYGLASSYNNIGWIYKESGQSDSALWYYREAIQLMQQTGARNLGHCYHNIASVYDSREDYSESKRYYLKAFAHKKSINDSNEMLITMNKLAKIENNQGHWKLALKYLKTSKRLTTSNPSKRSLKEHYFEWKNYYKGIEMTDSALYFLEQSNQLEQEILNESYLEELAELQESYEADKRKQDLKKLGSQTLFQQKKIGRKDRSINQLTWGIIAAALVILLLFLFILLLRQRTRKKELESKMRGVEDEKKRLSMELHDASGANLRNLANDILHLVESSKGVIQEQLEVLHKKTENTLSEIVMISHTLHHPRIETAIFSVLIEDFIYDWRQHKEYVYEQKIEGIEVLNSFTLESKSHIYRFIQETLINIDKHAKATFVTFTVEIQKDLVEICITDNGEKKENQLKKGIGHKNLEDRANIMNGSFKFTQTELGSISALTIPISINTK